MLARLCEPSSELHIAEDWYRRTALEDLLGIKPEAVYDTRLYRTLDRLLPHKRELEVHLKNRLGDPRCQDSCRPKGGNSSPPPPSGGGTPHGGWRVAKI